MIRLSKNKVDERYNIDDNGIIRDLQGNVQKIYINQNRLIFKGVGVHCIQMWTKFGYRDGHKWAIHHIDENKLNNNINNLIYLTRSEHTSLHMKGKQVYHSIETRNKISESLKGHTHSEESKRKMSEVKKGKNNAMYGTHWKINPDTGKRIWY